VNKAKLYLLFLFAFVLIPPAQAMLSHEPNVELGYQAAGNSDYELTRNRPYMLLGFNGKWERDTDEAPLHLSFKSSVRAWLDRDSNELDLRELSLGLIREQWSLTAGFQQIGWGETFGFFISDVVNPRDLRDPLFNDLSWIRIPVFALNARYYLGAFSIQGVLTPRARNNRYPDTLNGIPIMDNQPHTEEYGARVGYLAPFGTDFSAFYYRHWDRNFSLTPEKINSFGLGFSHTLGDFVLRGDAVYGDDLQVILGSDVQAFEYWNFGIQAQNEWLGTRIERKLFDDTLIAECFAFVGVDDSNFWVQPKLTWQGVQAMSVSIRGDIFKNTTLEENRILLWITYHPY
jgi:hypothetical protein